MIGKCIAFAVPLLPCFAFGADPSVNLSVQIIPVASGPTPPIAAQTVGFTTIALNADFTQPLPTNWLGGCPNGPDGSATNTNDDTGHIWYNAIWWDKAEPCTSKQLADPKYGGTTLDIPWPVHYDPSTSNGHGMQTASWNWPLPASGSPSVGFSAPNSAYYEITARNEPAADSNVMNFITWAATGITGGDAGIEWDVMEMSGLGGGDGAIHNWGAGGTGGWMWTTFNAQGAGNDILHADPSYDPAKYNTYGLRTVSDGTNLRWCTYINNHLIRCGDLPGGLTAAEKNQRLFVLPGTACYPGNNNYSCPLEGQTQHIYIRSIRVFSCASWAATECNLSSIPGP
jgi:hypothetical protein